MAHRINDECTGCGACVFECPVSAIMVRTSYLGNTVWIDASACTDCGVCVFSCPENAIDGP